MFLVGLVFIKAAIGDYIGSFVGAYIGAYIGSYKSKGMITLYNGISILKTTYNH